jgi:hypothetical protein
LSRIRIFALLATLAMMATAFAACGGGGSDEDPQTVIDNATLEGVTSGNLETTIGIKSEGAEGGDLKVSLSGPFESGGKGNLPQFALSASAKGSIGD